MSATRPLSFNDDGHDTSIYLDRANLCGRLNNLACPGTSMCSKTSSEKTEYQLWLNNTCSQTKGFPGMSQNWSEVVTAGVRSGSRSPEWSTSGDILTFPSCAQGACGDNLKELFTRVSDTFCVLDDTRTFCSSNVTAVRPRDFCRDISYGKTCGSNCVPFTERRSWVRYLNTTCLANNTSWHGLPMNWTTDLLNAQISDLRPWPTIVKNQFTPDLSNCPTAEANLGVFAAINVAMLVVTPFLGRRKVVARVTFGWLGTPHSRGWMFMGPLMAGLQVLANGINVALIKATPGYEDTDPKTLMMLWFTRPRLAWLAVLLVGLQAEEAMYFSCAATSLASEIILQLLSGFAMGTTANAGRIQGFYSNPEAWLAAAEHGGDALMLYVGAMAWLVVVFFTIFLVGVSLLSINDVISRLGNTTGRHTMRLQRSVESVLAKPRQSAQQCKVQCQKCESEYQQQRLEHTYRLQQQKDSFRTVLRCWLKLDGEVDTQVNILEHLTQSQDNRRVIMDGLWREYRAAIREMNKDLSSPDHDDIIDTLATRIRDTDQEEAAQLRRVFEKCDQHNERCQQLRYTILEEATNCYGPNLALKKTRELGGQLVELCISWDSTVSLLHKIEFSWERIRNSALSSSEYRDLRRRRLQSAVKRTALGMSLCWLAQWVIWIGFVRLYTPDEYCPPKLTYMALTWIFFSIAGAPLGAAY